jgi:hypothetical protein
MAVAEALSVRTHTHSTLQTIRSARRLDYLDSLKVVLTVLVISSPTMRRSGTPQTTPVSMLEFDGRRFV